MYRPDSLEMDRRQSSVGPPTGSSTNSMPEIEKVQIHVNDLEVERTLKRGLEARQVSTTTRLV